MTDSKLHQLRKAILECIKADGYLGGIMKPEEALSLVDEVLERRHEAVCNECGELHLVRGVSGFIFSCCDCAPVEVLEDD